MVIDRIKSNLEQFNTKEFADKYNIRLSLKIGVVEYDSESVGSPLDFIVQGKKQLEYDV